MGLSVHLSAKGVKESPVTLLIVEHVNADARRER